MTSEKASAGEGREQRSAGRSAGGSNAMAIGYYIVAIILVIGAMLVAYGLLGPAEQTDKSLGFNLNLWWGLFMVLFGCGAATVSFLATRRNAGG